MGIFQRIFGNKRQTSPTHPTHVHGLSIKSNPAKKEVPQIYRLQGFFVPTISGGGGAC